MSFTISKDLEKNILQNGVGAALPDLTVSHPVEEIQKRRTEDCGQVPRQGLAMVFGMHMPMRLAMEELTFSRSLRIAGLHSERPSREICVGSHADLGFEDILDDPRLRTGDVDFHSAMETRLGVTL